MDGFWSISVYNEKGFFEKNDLNAYSVNNLTAKSNTDGAFTIQFGGDPESATNYLPITPKWNYTVRLFRPRKEVIAGTWVFPVAKPVKWELTGKTAIRLCARVGVNFLFGGTDDARI